MDLTLALLSVLSGRFFEETLRNKLSFIWVLTCGFVSGFYCSNIEQMGLISSDSIIVRHDFWRKVRKKALPCHYSNLSCSLCPYLTRVLRDGHWVSQPAVSHMCSEEKATVKGGGDLRPGSGPRACGCIELSYQSRVAQISSENHKSANLRS